MSLIISILVNALILVSLRKKTAERRGRQNACVWQTWQAYYLCVLWWSSLKLMFSGLWEKDLFKGGWSSAEKFLIQIVVTLVTQGLPSSFLSRPVAQAHYCVVGQWLHETEHVQSYQSCQLFTRLSNGLKHAISEFENLSLSKRG